jgi:RNA polymerase sigma-70 factor (ECF subfamily)
MEIIKQNVQITFEKWVNEFSDELFSWALYKTSSKETAEDLVQETFLAAYHKIETFQEKSHPKTWLFSILNHKIIDYYRKNSKSKEKEVNINEKTGFQLTDDIFNDNENWKSNELNPIWDQEEALLDNQDFNKIMASCMDDLPLKWKEAVTSKYLTEKSAEEICQDLQISVTNYWQIVHRAKLLLKKCLEIKWV